MRKIEKQMVQAMRQGRAAGMGNTMVTQTGTGGAVALLHGSRVAIVERGYTRFTLAGWDTNTTRSRVNAVLREYEPGVSVGRHRGEPCVSYNGGRERIDPRAWYEVTSAGVREVQP